MPLYDYKCRDHGLFQELARMDEHGDPKPCPVCGTLASRVILLPPEVLDPNRAAVLVAARRERSVHAPLLSTADTRAEQADRVRHAFGRGCGCDADHGPIGKSQLFYTADGKKMFPSARPWMISH
jgi:putative FmdB family regulatory protein